MALILSRSFEDVDRHGRSGLDEDQISASSEIRRAESTRMSRPTPSASPHRHPNKPFLSSGWIVGNGLHPVCPRLGLKQQSSHAPSVNTSRQFGGLSCKSKIFYFSFYRAVSGVCVVDSAVDCVAYDALRMQAAAHRIGFHPNPNQIIALKAVQSILPADSHMFDSAGLAGKICAAG
jgi:hypothetical protein